MAKCQYCGETHSLLVVCDKNPNAGKPMKADIRKVYVMKFRFRKGDGYKVLYKIGISNDVERRVAEVCRSFFMKRRYFPEVEIRRARSSEEFFAIETALHQEFKEYKWDFKNLEFDGCQEFFDIDEEFLLNRYEEVLPKKK